MNLYPRITVIALLIVGLVAPEISSAQASPAAAEKVSQVESAVLGLHDFDFLVGHWQVHHRKLKQRLVNNHEWVEFEGTLFSQPLMGGYANVDDDVFDVPGGAYRGVAPRSFDAKSRQWSIWWMDSRTLSLGAGVLARWRQDVGNQLVTGPQTSAIVYLSQ